MWRLFIFIWAALSVGCAHDTIKNRQRAMLHLEMGAGHMSRGAYPAALGEFLQAEALDPKNPIVHNNLGLAYFVRGKLQLSETHFREAVRLEPALSEARNNLGRTLIEQKRYKEAIAELQTAEKDLVYSEPQKTYSNLGLANFYLSDFAAAEKYFLQALKLDRKNCYSLTFYGRSLYEQSAYEKAAESLDQAMSQCKSAKVEDPYYFSAMSYMKIGRREQALARLEEGLSSFPDGQYAAKARSMLEILR